MLQPRDQHVPGEIQGLRRPQRRTQKLHAGLGQLVRLIEHRQIDRRQQLGHTTVAQRDVGKKKVVIDHHHVGRHRLSPRLDDVAAPVFGAFLAEAVVAR